MRCTSINPFIRQDGCLISVLVMDNGSSKTVPFRREHVTLIGKDIHTEQDLIPHFINPLQFCPYCGTIAHNDETGLWCVNIHCVGLRRTILLTQLSLIGVTPPLQVEIEIAAAIARDRDFNLLTLVTQYPVYQGHLHRISLPRYLQMLRVPSLTDEDLEAINQVYPNAPALVEDVHRGQFLYRDLLISKSRRDAICLSIGYVNQVFAQQCLSFQEPR